jgi:predicted RNase H-like HicB family nuclease
MFLDVFLNMTHFAFIFQDGDYYVAKSPEGVASQGKTPQEAIENLKEALELYYEDGDMEYQSPFVTSFELPVSEKNDKVGV